MENSYIPSKGLRTEPPPDAAGLLGGSRWHGHTTPLLGRGTPPPDGFENADKRLKSWSPERSHLLQSKDVLNQWGGAPTPPPKASKRQFEPQTCNGRSWALHGGAIHVIEPEGTWTKTRGWGENNTSALDTGARALNVGHAPIGGHTQPGLLGTGRFTKKFDMEKPPSSPDVLTYQHAPGIWPRGHAMAAERVSSPTTQRRDPRADVQWAQTSNDIYERNRARGKQSYALG